MLLTFHFSFMARLASRLRCLAKILVIITAPKKISKMLRIWLPSKVVERNVWRRFKCFPKSETPLRETSQGEEVKIVRGQSIFWWGATKTSGPRKNEIENKIVEKSNILTKFNYILECQLSGSGETVDFVDSSLSSCAHPQLPAFLSQEVGRQGLEP